METEDGWPANVVVPVFASGHVEFGSMAYMQNLR